MEFRFIMHSLADFPEVFETAMAIKQATISITDFIEVLTKSAVLKKESY